MGCWQRHHKSLKLMVEELLSKTWAIGFHIATAMMKTSKDSYKKLEKLIWSGIKSSTPMFLIIRAVQDLFFPQKDDTE